MFTVVLTKPANRSCAEPGEFNPNSRTFLLLGIKTVTAEVIGSMLITHYTFLSTNGTKCIHLWSFVGNLSTMTVSVQQRLPQAALALLASSFVAGLGNQRVTIH
jgi:hypothetical protein